MASGNGLSLVCVEFKSKKIFLFKKLCKGTTSLLFRPILYLSNLHISLRDQCQESNALCYIKLFLELEDLFYFEHTWTNDAQVLQCHIGHNKLISLAPWRSGSNSGNGLVLSGNKPRGCIQVSDFKGDFPLNISENGGSVHWRGVIQYKCFITFCQIWGDLPPLFPKYGGQVANFGGIPHPLL